MTIEVFGTTMSAWQVFASLGVIFVILEAFVISFIMLPIGLAFFITALLSPLASSWIPLIGLLAFNLAVVFTIFQKLVKPRLKKTNYQTNVDSMIGKTATVTEKIYAENSGYVKLYGDLWPARCEKNQEIPIGTTVEILRVEGNKVFVKTV